ALRSVEAALLAMMHEDMQHDVLGHALGQIAYRHTDQGHIRKSCIRDKRIDTSAEIEDDLEIGKGSEQARRRFPDGHIAHALGRWRVLGPKRDGHGLETRREALPPRLGRPVLACSLNYDKKCHFSSDDWVDAPCQKAGLRPRVKSKSWAQGI